MAALASVKMTILLQYDTITNIIGHVELELMPVTDKDGPEVIYRVDTTALADGLRAAADEIEARATPSKEQE